jgi:ribonuclease HI
MEALAVRDGVKLASDLGFTHVEVETDATEVVKLWNERAQGRSESNSSFGD